jgi:hypothetical protein
MDRILFQESCYPLVQNRTYASPEEASLCSTGDIVIVQDHATGLIYNKAFDPNLILYDSCYNNEQSLSSRFQKHLNEVAGIIETKIGRNGVIEVGCGKGFFLELLLKKGFDVQGFDPTYTGTNPRVEKTFFKPGIVEQAEGLILRHVLEHVPNPVSFLRELSASNRGQGKIYIEVPCLDWISRNKTWQDIFYEHVNYFRKEDFLRIFDSVSEIGHLFDGQYLYVVADLNSIRTPQRDPGDNFEFPDDFTKSLTDTKLDQPFGVWGAASKGVIFSLLKSRTGQNVDFVIDINEAKQGRFLPCTGLKVLSPSAAMESVSKGTTVYVMNPNYLREIEGLNHGYFTLKLLDDE